ncbi:hypothetical protein [Nannocystis radixulma]|uniref:Uncharacterized protein n=1 Tax=Nannocystis radixulma TaxID=2995305 RepID=A0ABT5AXE6_9BACT|nr:hypothetical protein [Nannocystis radixulma]MDC0666511.1 hypothetical protein [Nannocystis radixulma]
MRLPIVQPCGEDWEAMRPGAGGRHCERCRHEVLDLSALTEGQARRLLAARKGQSTCVRARVSADGHALFRRERQRVLPAAAAVALAACAPHTPEAQQLAPASEVEAVLEVMPPRVIPEGLPQQGAAPQPEPGPPKPPARVKGKAVERDLDVLGLIAWDED